MSVPRELVDQIRRLDEYELRRVLILVRGLLLDLDGPPTPDERGLPPNLTYRQEEVRCGKATCRSCPHGPYWYAYWKEDGRTRKRYIGRHLPGEPLEPVVPDLAVDRADDEVADPEGSDGDRGDDGRSGDAGRQ
jgi:hypothetical protein